MNESLFEQIQADAKYLKIDLRDQEMAQLSEDKNMNPESIQAVADTFRYLKDKKNVANVSTLLRLSRLPLKEPKTFENFDFSQIHGQHADSLKNLPALTALYAHENMAFIGPPGTGKTHLAMAYGRECCKKGMKTYFLKTTELNQKLTDARKTGQESHTVASLVKPTCLIIDEVGRCVFDKENTQLFFDIIDRRYNKEGPNTMIFTSNKSPDKWNEFFREDSSLLCAIDRIFDHAVVYMIKGNSYRGRKREMVTLTSGESMANLNN